MPLFNKKSNKLNSSSGQFENNNTKGSMVKPAAPTPELTRQQSDSANTPKTNVTKPQLVFHCQLAHGSPTGLITGFASVKELYSKIAECYDFGVDEVSWSFFIFLDKLFSTLLN